MSLIALVTVLLVGSAAGSIFVAQHQARTHSLNTFQLRDRNYADFVSTYLSQQESREHNLASTSLTSAVVSPEQQKLVTSAFGSDASVLLDAGGRVLDIVPDDPALVGVPIAGRYPQLTSAEHGQGAVSGVVPSAAKSLPVIAIAVPFKTPQGRRVFSVGYQVGGSALKAFVDHAVPYRLHDVFLVDSSNHIVAASPPSSASTLGQASARLSKAIATSPSGSVDLDQQSFAYTATSVGGTGWHLIIAVPTAQLLATTRGWNGVVPWIIFGAVVLLALATGVLFLVELRQRRRLVELSTRLAHAARTDPLTGLSNRRDLQEHLDRLGANSRRHHQVLTILMLDIDHFKSVNDHYGHEAGDEVLMSLADSMRIVCRTGDIFGRWGGDEFLVILPMAEASGGFVVAERLREVFGERRPQRDGAPVAVDLSIGCASAVGDADLLVRQADGALYEAKAGGRGRVVMSSATSLT
jgi:diguanylate cyclase (GGDEF)-like protein